MRQTDIHHLHVCYMTKTVIKAFTWAVMIAIFSICNISFHGLRPLALYFSQGFMKKYLSLRLKSSTTLDSGPGCMSVLHLQRPLAVLSSDLTANRRSMSSICHGKQGTHVFEDICQSSLSLLRFLTSVTFYSGFFKTSFNDDLFV